MKHYKEEAKFLIDGKLYSISMCDCGSPLIKDKQLDMEVCHYSGELVK